MTSGVPLQAERLLRVLGEHEVEFVIIGGFALSAHGVIRGTKDIDIVKVAAGRPQDELDIANLQRVRALGDT